MPGQDVEEVVASLINGHAFLAPYGTSLPTTEVSALSTGFEDIGYVEETNGIKIAATFTQKDIGAWTFLDPIRRLRTARSIIVSAGLRQFAGASLDAVFGPGAWSVVSAGHFRYELGDIAPAVSFVFEFDDTYTYRLVIPHCTPTENVDLTFIHTDTVVVPLGLSALKVAGTPIAYVLTDDPSFSEAGS